MITGQVSVLVPVVVGVIGVVGVVAGQLVNAWREDRRWAREKEREDTRWLRETAREAAKLDRETKISVYGRLVKTLVCSDEMLIRFHDLLLEIRVLPAAMYGLDVEDPRTKQPVIPSSPREVLLKIAEYRRLFLELARKELRLDAKE